MSERQSRWIGYHGQRYQKPLRVWRGSADMLSLCPNLFSDHQQKEVFVPTLVLKPNWNGSEKSVSSKNSWNSTAIIFSRLFSNKRMLDTGLTLLKSDGSREVSFFLSVIFATAFFIKECHRKLMYLLLQVSVLSWYGLELLPSIYGTFWFPLSLWPGIHPHWALFTISHRECFHHPTHWLDTLFLMVHEDVLLFSLLQKFH